MISPNTFKKHYTDYVVLCMLLASMAYSCKSPLEGVVIKIKDPIATSAVSVYYANANIKDTERVPKDLKITITGADADKIVNSVGTAKISVSKEGILGIAVSPTYTTRPVKIKIIAEAEGYTKSVEEITITGLGNTTRNTLLFKTGSLPTGITMSSGNIQAKNSQPLLLKTANDQAQLSLPDDVVYKDKEGQTLTGELSVSLTYFTNGAKAFIPSSSLVYNAIGTDGKLFKPFEFNTFGFFSVKIFNEKAEEVATLSKPFTALVEVSEEFPHANGTKLKEGDKIPYWVFWNNQWLLLGETLLKRNASGKLETQIGFGVATTYAFGEMIPVCERGPNLVTNSPFVGMDTYYFAKLIEASSGKVLDNFYMSLNNAANLSLAGKKKNTVIMQLYNYNNHYGGNLTQPVFQTAPFDLCDEKNIKVDVVIPQPKSVTLEITIKCPQGKVLDESEFPAEMQIQYQPQGASSTEWRDLMTLTRAIRKVTSYKLNIGSKYSLRASTNPAQGWPFYQRDTTIKQDYYLLKLDGQAYCK